MTKTVDRIGYYAWRVCVGSFESGKVLHYDPEADIS